MNCTDCQRVILENGGRGHDAALAAHLADCPACAKVNDQTLTIAKLIGLKRYEQPNPHVEMRTAAAIRKRISEERAPLFVWNPVSLFRPIHALLGAACLCVAAGGVYYSANVPQGPANNVAQQQPVKAVPPEVINPGLAKPLIVLQEPAPGKGAAPAHTQFGAETNQIKPADFNVPPR